jgi:hypothetical protein
MWNGLNYALIVLVIAALMLLAVVLWGLSPGELPSAPPR